MGTHLKATKLIDMDDFLNYMFNTESTHFNEHCFKARYSHIHTHAHTHTHMHVRRNKVFFLYDNEFLADLNFVHRMCNET